MTTTTPSVKFVNSGALTRTTTVIMVLTYVGLAAALGQHAYGSGSTTDPDGHRKGCWPHNYAAAAAQFVDVFSSLCLLCHGSSSGEFSFLEFSLPLVSLCWCLFWCLLSSFRLQSGCHFHQWGLSHWGLHYCNPFQCIPRASIGVSWCWSVILARGALHSCSLHCLK